MLGRPTGNSYSIDLRIFPTRREDGVPIGALRARHDHCGVHVLASLADGGGTPVGPIPAIAGWIGALHGADLVSLGSTCERWTTIAHPIHLVGLRIAQEELQCFILEVES